MSRVCPLFSDVLGEVTSQDIPAAAERAQNLHAGAVGRNVGFVVTASDWVLAELAHHHGEEARVVHVPVHRSMGNLVRAAAVGVAALDEAESAVARLMLLQMLVAACDEAANCFWVFRVAQRALDGRAGAFERVLVQVRDECGAVLAPLRADGDGRRSARVPAQGRATSRDACVPHRRSAR